MRPRCARCGYPEANERLQTLNVALEEKNQEFARAKADAEAANRELEAFSYSVAHDLRAPLRTIDGFSLAVLEDAKGLDARGQEHLRRVRVAAQRMGELIDDLLELAKISRSQLLPERIDLSALATDVVAELRRSEPRREVQLVVQAGLTAWADPRLLRVAIENLIANAWKFTAHAAHAVITLGDRPSGKSHSFFLEDNGVGFDPAGAGRLFTAFQRLHSQSEFPGTGIGLATVARIISRHGGRTWAEGRLGAGATFWWTLPELVGDGRAASVPLLTKDEASSELPAHR